MMRIRVANESDYDNLVEFWNKNSEWDIIDRKTWEDRFINSPLGSSVIFITERNNEIIAQVIFIRLDVVLMDQIINACRPFAAVIDNNLKGLTGFRFIAQIYNYSLKILAEMNFDLVFFMPDPRWKPISRLIKVSVAEFPLFKIEIKQYENITKTDFNVKSIGFDDPDIDDLWKESMKLKLNMIVRNKEILKWKNSHRNYQIIGIYKREKLIGIAVYIEKGNEKQIQICDILYAKNEFLSPVVNAIRKFLNHLYINSEFKKIVILVTDNLKESLIKSGFIQDDYNFLFGIKRLNKKISKEKLNISNWYLSAND